VKPRLYCRKYRINFSGQIKTDNQKLRNSNKRQNRKSSGPGYDVAKKKQVNTLKVMHFYREKQKLLPFDDNLARAFRKKKTEKPLNHMIFND